MLEQVVLHQSESGVASKRQATASSAKVIRYLSDRLIPDQPMFLAAIVSALKLNNMRHLHSHWTSLVTNCLPFLDHSLTSTVMEVTTQLAANLEQLVPFYDDSSSSASSEQIEHFGQVPADYVITQMEALTMMYHFCLIEDSVADCSIHVGLQHHPPPNEHHPEVVGPPLFEVHAAHTLAV